MPYFLNETESVKFYIMYILKLMLSRLTLPQLVTAVTEATGIGCFDIQLSLSELEHAGYIISETAPSGERYMLSPRGNRTVVLLAKSMPASSRHAIDKYVAENRERIAAMGYFSAKMRKNPAGGYDAVLSSVEDDRIMLALTINVADRTTADRICSSWENKTDKVYRALYDILNS